MKTKVGFIIAGNTESP